METPPNSEETESEAKPIAKGEADLMEKYGITEPFLVVDLKEDKAEGKEDRSGFQKRVKVRVRRGASLLNDVLGVSCRIKR